MKGLSVRLTDAALLDLFEIGFYVYQRSLSAATARAYTARIRNTCERIGDAPYGGRLREEAGREVRSWTFERQVVIFYRIGPRSVDVMRILHGGRQLEGVIEDGQQS